jgi:hypothetical protein
MNNATKLAALLTLLTTLATPSLFADNRNENRPDRWRGRHDAGRHVVVEGRIRDIDRERNGFVIRLGRGEELFVPVQVHGARRLDDGDYIRVSGRAGREGRVYVERITEVREDRDSYVAGIVQRVDRRGDIVWLEEARSRRVIAVDMRRVDRDRRRYDVDDLRHGDRIRVSGEWRRDGRFEAERLDVDRGAWW